MITVVIKAMHILGAGLLAVAVVVTFISPITDLLPAPVLKYAPSADFFDALLLLAFALALRAFFVTYAHCSRETLAQTSHRLDLICSRRC